MSRLFSTWTYRVSHAWILIDPEKKKTNEKVAHYWQILYSANLVIIGLGQLSLVSTFPLQLPYMYLGSRMFRDWNIRYECVRLAFGALQIKHFDRSRSN